MDTEYSKNGKSKFQYYYDLYEEKFGKAPEFCVVDGNKVEKMKKAIETGEEYDIEKDTELPRDYVDESGAPIVL